jgi:hypothetical protein
MKSDDTASRRPRAPAPWVRNVVVQVRFTRTEADALRRAAEAACKPLARFLRDVVMEAVVGRRDV